MRLSDANGFVSWTICSADSYCKACHVRAAYLPGAISEITAVPLGNFTSSHLIVLFTKPAATTCNNLLPDVNSLPIHAIDLFGFHSILHILHVCLCILLEQKFFGKSF